MPFMSPVSGTCVTGVKFCMVYCIGVVGFGGQLPERALHRLGKDEDPGVQSEE